MTTMTAPAKKMHQTYEQALKVTRDLCRDSEENLAAIAAYAYDHQVAVFHAHWAFYVRNGQNYRACNCRPCINAHLEQRAAGKAVDARRRYTGGLMAKYGHLDAIKVASPDWWVQANEISQAAAHAENVLILNELEAGLIAW